jgi:hypothetical protein
MKAKKKAVLVIVIALIIIGGAIALFAGETTGIEITSTPDNILYIIGIDNELILDGGLVEVITGIDIFETRTIKSMTDESVFSISHDIDFAAEGIYIVDVILNSADIRASFPVQVVSLEEIILIIESTLE